MAYFEKTKLSDKDGNLINPSEEVTLLRSIFRLLKPLGFVTGSQSNRLSVDVNNIVGGTVALSSGTVTTVTTATNITNVAPGSGTIGGVTGFDLMKAMSRTAYNSGIRSNIT